MSDTDRAKETFKEGFSCCQAVLSTCGPRLGLARETSLRIAGAFGGGMGRMGYTCGAVTGALMVIGLKHGRTEAGDDEAKEKTYAITREFLKRFEERAGSTVCRDLLGVDISSPEGLKRINEDPYYEKFCSELVEKAVEILEEVL